MDCDFRKRSLLHSTLLLLEKRRASQSDENGGIREAIAYASGVEERSARVEGRSLYGAEMDFVFPSLRRNGLKTTRPGRSAEPKNQTRVREARNRGSGLAYFSAFSRKYSCQHGRTPAYSSLLPAPQQPQRYQPILASDFEHQASRTRETGRRDPAHGIVVRKQVDSDSINPARLSPAPLGIERCEVSFVGHEALNGP